MNDNVIHLLPAKEEAILRCYVTGARQPASFRKLYDALEIPVVDTIPGIISRLQIAVAQILLHDIQDSLPQWAATFLHSPAQCSCRAGRLAGGVTEKGHFLK